MKHSAFVLLTGLIGGCAPAPRTTTPPPQTVPAAAVPADEGTWRAYARLLPDKSAAACRRGGGFFDFSLRDDVLFVTPRVGDAFSIPVAKDGSVRHAWKVASQPPRFIALEMMGNARSRDLEIFNPARACRFKLVTPPPILARDDEVIE